MWQRCGWRGEISTAAVALVAMVSVGRAASLTPVLQANPKSPGFSVPNVLSVELSEAIAAQGSNRVENPMSVDLGNGTTLTVPFYGYDGDGPLLPLAGDVQTPDHNVEATKTEPDKNTYLVMSGQHGADPSYDYGTHFLYQGHEGGPADASNRDDAAITRINLDADGAHRVTLLAIADIDGKSIPAIDGSTWDPFAQRLLFTAEQGAVGGVWQATPDFPSAVEPLAGSVGHASYEGVQNDEDGNLWLVEDSGGATGATNDHARQPNSFLFRFVPDQPDDLKHGKLQALRVFSLRTGQPIVFHPGQADADALSDDVHDLHTYGNVFSTRWITVHDTTVDTIEFNANALAKAAGATPFKRPENGQFRPGSHFTEFFFDETGDTDNRTQAGSAFGGFGAILKLTQSSPSADTGQLTLFYLGDVVHAAFDNVAFWSDHEVVFVEDAGDTLHTQRNALDSAWMFDVNTDYSVPSNQPIRILAEGRDASATLDSSLGSVGGSGFQNEGDNEITGIHISDGDPSAKGLLGAKRPHLFKGGWRVFYTQQHGDNVTWEILPSRGSRSH
jgi:hypothetical protein